ncbi:MAG: nucleotidyltransferase [Desulfitobacteriaceae bacterium]|nr:nucleotidyltransferase [Desulfitobacteriaceae bacterium]
MSRDWEAVFTTWSQGPSKTEEEKIENAERQIREAIKSSDALKSRNITVFTQGSYRNRVNVRKDSDVDIGILCFDTYFPEYADGNVKNFVEKNSVDSTYTYQTFKREIEEALVARFGKEAVSRGNKSFDIKANSYRVEADVAAFFEHRRYTSVNNYLSGVEMIPDDYNPPRVRNWPEQHYTNGVWKNDNTNRHFKRVVRILKNLSNEMANNNIEIAEQTPSFLIECLAWNAPNNLFSYSTLMSTVREVLAFLFNNTMSDNTCSEWGEVSELKYLFRVSQPWTRQQAHNFINAAWDYVGYK